MNAKRRVTVDGKRYTVKTRSYDAMLTVRIRHLDETLPAGTTIDQADLQDVVRRQIDGARHRHAAAVATLSRADDFIPNDEADVQPTEYQQ